MTATLLLLALPIRLALPPEPLAHMPSALASPRQRRADSWLGADKAKHFLLAGFAQSVGYASLRISGAPHGGAAIGAAGVTISLATFKELRDRRAYGHFSVRDLVWSAAGAGAASLLLSRTAR